MDIQRRKRPLYKDKNLVAEQPGMMILISGLVLAFFIGFTLKGFLNPAKIQQRIVEAASQIHKDVQFSMKSAEISLSNGFWPRFSVLVSDVVLVSENECWMKPYISVNEIELPINLWSLLWGEVPISTVQADQVILRLRGEKKDCRGEVLQQVNPRETPVAKTITLVQRETESLESRPSIHRVFFQKLEILPDAYPLAATEFKNVDLSVKSHQPRILNLTAETHVLKDEQWGDYAAHAQIHVEYTEFPDKNIDASVVGHWREGSYTLKTNYKVDQGSFQTELELKHIPISKLAQMSQRWGLKSLEHLKQSWISLKANSSGNSWDLAKIPLNIQDLKMEGDTGLIRIDQLQWRNLKETYPLPFLVQFESLSLQTLLKALTQTTPSPILGDLGIMTGRAEVDSLDRFKLIGELRGLEFYFSNQGQRIIQKIKSLNIEAEAKAQQLSVRLSRIEPEQGVFNGEIHSTSVAPYDATRIHVVAEEVVLAPSVQKLMTRGGTLGKIQSTLDFDFKQGRLDKLRGQLIGKNLEIAKLEMPQLQIQIQPDSGARFQIQISSPQVKVPGSFLNENQMSTLFQEFGFEDAHESKEIRNFKAVLRLNDFRAVKWKQLQLFFPGGQLSGTGEWNEDGQLTGQLQIYHGSNSKKYLLDGTRDEPLLRGVDERARVVE